MIKVKKSESTSLKGKSIVITDDKFVDFETGEEINMVSILKDTFGEAPFDITVVQRFDTEEEG